MAVNFASVPSTHDGRTVVNITREQPSKVADPTHGTFTGVCLVNPCPVHGKGKEK